MSECYFCPDLSQFRTWLKQQNYSDYAIVCDSQTLIHCLPRLLPQIQDLNPKIASFQAGEAHKNLHTAQELWQTWTNWGLNRRSLIINLGGGVVSDLGGFCAATFKRGLDFVHLPTTLLAQVDACWGGKTGIDFQGFKNHIGLFAPPKAVFIWADFLQTLDQRQVRSGLAELLKHALIADAELWDELQTLPPTLKPSPNWLPLIQRGLNIKAHIVAQDPQDQGLRQILNLGHTLGHALEAWSWTQTQPLLHGEAIAWGIQAELALMPQLPPNIKQNIILGLQRFFPPSSLGTLPPRSELLPFLLQDKKSTGKQGFYLPILKAIGQADYLWQTWDACLIEA